MWLKYGVTIFFNEYTKASLIESLFVVMLTQVITTF